MEAKCPNLLTRLFSSLRVYVFVLPVSVHVVTCQRQDIVFRSECQLGAKAPHLTWFLSWKRDREKKKISLTNKEKQENDCSACMNMCWRRWSKKVPKKIRLNQDFRRVMGKQFRLSETLQNNWNNLQNARKCPTVFLDFSVFVPGFAEVVAAAHDEVNAGHRRKAHYQSEADFSRD